MLQISSLHQHIQTTVSVFLRYWTAIFSSIVNDENDIGREDHTARKLDSQLKLLLKLDTRGAHCLTTLTRHPIPKINFRATELEQD